MYHKNYNKKLVQTYSQESISKGAVAPTSAARGVADTGAAARGVADTGAAVRGVAVRGAATPAGAAGEQKRPASHRRIFFSVSRRNSSKFFNYDVLFCSCYLICHCRLSLNVFIPRACYFISNLLHHNLILSFTLF
jgi:hypothetical protein